MVLFIIPALWRLWWGDYHEFRASLDFIVRLSQNTIKEDRKKENDNRGLVL